MKFAAALNSKILHYRVNLIMVLKYVLFLKLSIFLLSYNRIRSYEGHYMGVALVKNNEMMTSVYTDASERSIMQSQSIILYMQPGDMVWLELGSSERFAVHSDIHKYVTFNGFLIFKGR